MHCTISLRHSQIDLTIHFVSFTFNSHPSIGQFIATTSSRDTLLVFQFTHPRGMRPLASRLMEKYKHFNSRIHTGCGLAKMRMYFRRQKYFNSRIHTECGQCPGWLTSLKTDFNSHIHTECGSHRPRQESRMPNFNSHIHTECGRSPNCYVFDLS